MSRLIDADALLAEYDRMHEGEPGKARKLIEDAPTIERLKITSCKDCEYFHIRCEYKNPYEWGEAVCEKHNLITDFRSKKKLKTLSCIEVDTQKGGKNETLRKLRISSREWIRVSGKLL